MATVQEAIRRLIYRYSVEGADKVIAANQNIATTSEKSDRASLSLEKAFAGLERRYNSTIRAQQDFQKVQDKVNAAVAQNPALQARANAVLALAATHFDQVSKSQRAMAAATASLQSSTMTATSSLGAMGGVLTALGPAGIAVAVGLGAVGLAIKAAADASLALADRAGKLRDFSETTGFTVVQLQALEKAGAQVGVSSESVSKGLERFSAVMVEVRESTGPVYESLLQIDAGLARQISRTNSLSDAWDLVSIASQKATLEQRNQLERQISGRGGIELTRLRASTVGAGGVAGLVAELKQVDLITAQQAERWDTLGDKIAESMKAAKQNITAAFAGPVLELLEKASGLFLNISRYARSLDESIGNLAIRMGIGERRPGAATAPGSPSADRALRDELHPDAAAAENQRRETIRAYNDMKRWMDLLGEAATPTEKLRLKQLELAAAIAKTGESQDIANRAFRHAAVEMSTAALNARIGALGDLATADEVVLAKQRALNEANRMGAKLTDDETRAILAKTRLQAEYAKLPNQLAFERDQLGRSDIDATVASRLRSANLPIDFNSAEAGLIRFNEQMRQAKDLTTEFVTGFAGEFRSQLRQGASAWDAFGKAGLSALTRLSDKLMDMALSNLVARAFGGSAGGGLMSLIGGGGGATDVNSGYVPHVDGGGVVAASARGNVFYGGNIVPFARGGIIGSPIIFPMANGAGLAGEAGPEAIMPLRRVGGRLGVDASGGGNGRPVKVIVNNYVSGATAEAKTNSDGDTEIKLVRSVVQQELAKPSTMAALRVNSQVSKR